MKATLIIVTLCCLTCIGAHGQSLTGNQLLQKLNAESIDGAMYLAGVVDAASTNRLSFKLNVAKVDEKLSDIALRYHGIVWGCTPEKATYGQIADVTVSYLKRNPNVRHIDAVLLISMAMKEAWPCN